MYSVYLYLAPSIKDHHLNLQKVQHVFDRIYEQNTLCTIRSVLVSRKTGMDIENKRITGLLKANEHIIKLMKSQNHLPGSYCRQYGSYVNIAPFQQLNKSKVCYQGELIEADLNYQVGYTLAHECLHRLLDQIVSVYELDGLNVFRLTTGGAKGYANHVTGEWNLLQPGVMENGHDNYMGIPISPASPFTAKMERILPHHIAAIRQLLETIHLDADSAVYEHYWTKTRAILLKQLPME